MNVLNYYVTHSHSGPDWSTSLFDTSYSVIYWSFSFFDTQRPKQRSIEILIENETTEQMNNKIAQQVSEINGF